MRVLHKSLIVAVLLWLSATIAYAAPITYQFFADTPESFAGGFTYTAPDFVSSDTETYISADLLDACSASGGTCAMMSFLPAMIPGYDAIGFGVNDSGGGIVRFFYFQDGALSSLGNFDTEPFSFTGRLIVTDAGAGNPVPEPGTMMLLGSGLVGLVGFGRMKLKK